MIPSLKCLKNPKIFQKINKSKARKNLENTIKNNSRLSFQKLGNDTTIKASKNSEEKAKSISSISIQSSINIDPDEARKPIKRTQTNMINVGGLSDYKFIKRTSTKDNIQLQDDLQNSPRDLKKKKKSKFSKELLIDEDG
mmetsp:Transcript_21509/g.19079  ORF Transcript_21509/g.19079 Transcript_21509/m.19079 type:complete len:140 (+) Transcript_21509:394-813(+)